VTSTQLGRFKMKLETRLKELSSNLRNRENIAVERTPDALDDVELAGERDLAIWSLDKCFAQVRFCGGSAGPHCRQDLRLLPSVR